MRLVYFSVHRQHVLINMIIFPYFSIAPNLYPHYEKFINP